jgi:transcriptional regulator with XRE-family HTH domain
MALHEAVAEEVRVILVRRRIKQQKLAEDLGWTPWYLGRRLRGETPFDVQDLETLGKVLDIEPTEFFPGSARSVGGGDIKLRKCAQPGHDQSGCVTRLTFPSRYSEDSSPFENRTLDANHAVAA